MSDHPDTSYEPPQVDEIETDVPFATAPGNGTVLPPG
jgi:hypothetical protein